MNEINKNLQFIHENGKLFCIINTEMKKKCVLQFLYVYAWEASGSMIDLGERFLLVSYELSEGYEKSEPCIFPAVYECRTALGNRHGRKAEPGKGFASALMAKRRKKEGQADMADYKPVDITEYPEIFHGFYRQKIIIENRSQNTVSEYLFDLCMFFRFLKKKKDGIAAEDLEDISLETVDLSFVSAVTTADIYDFLEYLAVERKNKISIRARRLSSIKVFYKYLTDKAGLLDRNPADHIDSPKGVSRRPKYLTVEESLSLLESVRNDTESKTKARDYAILTLFLNCGMRLSELTGISMNDLSKDLQTVRVLGKGNKERWLYLNDACKDALTDYLKERTLLLPRMKDKTPLFVSGRMTRISQKTVQWLVYKYLDRAGLAHKNFSTHKLRHTAATLLYQSGEVDVLVLKDILGHEQLNTTQIYTHLKGEEQRAAMAHHPLAGVNNRKNTDQKK